MVADSCLLFAFCFILASCQSLSKRILCRLSFLPLLIVYRLIPSGLNRTAQSFEFARKINGASGFAVTGTRTWHCQEAKLELQHCLLAPFPVLCSLSSAQILLHSLTGVCNIHDGRQRFSCNVAQLCNRDQDSSADTEEVGSFVAFFKSSDRGAWRCRCLAIIFFRIGASSQNLLIRSAKMTKLRVNDFLGENFLGKRTKHLWTGIEKGKTRKTVLVMQIFQNLNFF